MQKLISDPKQLEIKVSLNERVRVIRRKKALFSNNGDDMARGPIRGIAYNEWENGIGQGKAD